MRWRRSLGAVGALALSGAAALAEPATPEGAMAIERGYSAYFSKEVVDRGIVSVEPQGDGYLVTWNLQKALEAADVPKGSFQIDNLSYVVVPGENDAWVAKTDHLPRITFDVPTDKGQAKGVVDFETFRLDNSYDPSSDEFLRSTMGADSLTGTFHIAEGADVADFKLVEEGLTVETRAKPSAEGAGIDVAFAQAVKSMTETVLAAPSGDAGGPIEMTFTMGSFASGATLQGLRAKEIGEFWRYAVVHAGDATAPPALAQLLRAMLPLWTEFRAEAKIDDLQLQMPQGKAAMKSLSESVDLSGLMASGIIGFGIKIEDLGVTSAMLPDWASSLSPASFDLELRLTGGDWDKAALVALDDPHFDETGDLSPEASEQFLQILLAGRPKVMLTPGHLRLPVLDLAFEGEAVVSPDAPSAHFNISVDSLDKAMALLQDFAKAEPDAQNALLGLTFIKGLAATSADGRLVWDVETNGGAVTVNGSPLPTGP